jgi:hypothetical protein
MRDNYFSKSPSATGHGHFWRSEVTNVTLGTLAAKLVLS